MSKFCGVISKRLNSEQNEPMRFEHLELLTNWLTSETESLVTDFQTKSAAVLDMQREVVQNGNKLNEIHSVMHALNEKLASTELELQVNDASIKMLETNIKALDEYTNRPQTPAGITCGYPLECVRQSEQHSMLNLLQQTDRTMTQLRDLMHELHELAPQMMPTSNKINAISSILDSHVTTLKQTERNMDHLLDKLNAVDSLFQLAMQRLATSCQNRSHSPPTNFDITTDVCTKNTRF